MMKVIQVQSVHLHTGTLIGNLTATILKTAMACLDGTQVRTVDLVGTQVKTVDLVGIQVRTVDLVGIQVRTVDLVGTQVRTVVQAGSQMKILTQYGTLIVDPIHITPIIREDGILIITRILAGTLTMTVPQDGVQAIIAGQTGVLMEKTVLDGIQDIKTRSGTHITTGAPMATQTTTQAQGGTVADHSRAMALDGVLAILGLLAGTPITDGRAVPLILDTTEAPTTTLGHTMVARAHITTVIHMSSMVHTSQATAPTASILRMTRTGATTVTLAARTDTVSLMENHMAPRLPMAMNMITVGMGMAMLKVQNG